MRETNGSAAQLLAGYTYQYVPCLHSDGDEDFCDCSEINVRESMKMDAFRHKLAPNATDLANRTK